MPFDSYFTNWSQRKKPFSSDYQEVFDKAINKELRKQPFKPPKLRFNQCSEKQRQQIAIERANADSYSD